MKFGSETGSLVNHFMSQGSTPEVKIGMGATLLFWTDREAATVVSYDEKRMIVGVQEDDAKRIDNNGMSESQVYEFTPNPDAYVQHFKFGPKGWVGVRSKFHDFSF